MEKSAIVTGASTGIGFAIARELGRAGFALTIASRRTERIERAAAELAGEGIAVRATTADLRDPAAPAALVELHGEGHGALDVLVNNAGMGIVGSLETMPEKHISLQIDVNLRAAALAYRAAIPLLRRAADQRGSALVVNVASIAAERPQPRQPIYTATKAGLVGLTRAMNVDLGPFGIRSCALCPGFVATEMTAGLDSSVAAEEMIPAEDVASAVGWLVRTSPQTVVPEIPFLRRGDSA